MKKKPLYELSEYFRVFPSIRVKWIVFFFLFLNERNCKLIYKSEVV